MPLGKKIKIYYDPRGQAIKTVNPDDSLQTVFFGDVTDLEHPENYTPSPWVSFTYDANDNGDRRTGGRGLTPLSNIDTPKSAEIDALGRTIKTTEHNAHYDVATTSYQDVVMQYKYDLRGNLLEVTDPRNRIAFLHKYDYANRGLWTQHIDSGDSLVNMDVMGKPVEATDQKGADTLSSYDLLNRPIRLWAKDNTGATRTLRQYMIYGDDLTATGYTDTQTKDLNLYGKGWKAYDEAGMVHTEDYDFKGNLLEKNRQVIKDSELLGVFSGPPVNWQVTPYLVDWTGLPVSTLLDSQQFITTMEYDALNRAMKVTYPQDVNGNRKELIPTYNRAGTLTSVEYDGDQYLKEIAYNAKGQPLLTAYGNGIMTRYVYDEDTFRTVRLKSEGYTYSYDAGTRTHTYAYNSGTTKQDFAYEYDLIGNIMQLHDRTPDGGLTATPDALDRLFNYDPLYRVISATGRESTGNGPSFLWADAPVAGSPNASNCRSYLQTYEYDKLGNMMELGHTASSNNYTRLYDYHNLAASNKLKKITNAAGTTTYSNFTYDVNGNMTGSDTDRKYVWDAADQLKAFYIQAGTGEPSVYAQYLYSGGQRVKKIVRTSGGDYEVTVYDGPFEYCKKVSGATTYEKNYSHVEGIAEIRTGTAFPGDITDSVVYQLPDHLGSSNLRLSTTGTVIDKEEYYPFGDTSLRTFTYKRYRYVGKEKDSESGLYYYGARYYASWTCRFISVDPLADQYAHLNPYNYAGNKPINSIDIDGMQGSNEPTSNEPRAQQTSPDNNQTDFTTEENLPIVNVTSVEVKEKWRGNFIQGVGRFLKGVGQGLWESTKAVVNIFNPNLENNTVKKTMDGLYALSYGMIFDHKNTTKGIVKALKDVDWGDPATYGRLVPDLISGGFLRSVKILKGVNTVAEVADKIEDVASVATDVSKVADAVPTIPAGPSNYRLLQKESIISSLTPKPANDYRSLVSGKQPAVGSLDIMPAGDNFSVFAKRSKPLDNYYDVIAHGDPTMVEYGKTGINHRILANLIKRSPDYVQGQPIRLLSCNTGNIAFGNNNFAQRLSNKLGVEVLAPSGYLWVTNSGQFSITRTLNFSEGNTGKFNIFIPKR